MATAIMTFDSSNPAQYVQGQVVYYNGAFYTIVANNPRGTPDSSTDFTAVTATATGVTGVTGTDDSGSGTGILGTLTTVVGTVNGLVGTVNGLVETVNNLLVSQTYDPSKGEQSTGATYKGKAVYRRAFEFTTNRAANTQDDRMLINQAGYVDAIVNTGGYWMTGNAAEKYPVNAAYVAPQALYGFAYVDTANKLVFRSNSSLNRDGSAATTSTFVWVEYTRVDSTTAVAPSAV